MPTDMHGHKLVPGVNVAKIDVAAGLRAAYEIGFTLGEDQMAIGMFLNEFRRGEEDSAQKRFLRSFANDLTSWTRILAAAMAAAEAPVETVRRTRKWVTLEVQVEWRSDEPEPRRPDVAKAVAECTVGALKVTDHAFDILQVGEADPQQLAYDNG